MTALIIVGHGSHVNPESATPIYDMLPRACRIAEFDDVRPAFWKEEPFLHEVLRSTAAPDVVIVPMFISEGYFTQRVLPRELGLDAPDYGVVQRVDGRRVSYTAPVGTHAAMTEVLERRALNVLSEANVDPTGAAIIVAGHGTPRSARSARAINRQVEALRQCERFSEVRSGFMDDDPAIPDVVDSLTHDHVVVLPFFISDGMHTTEDIPELLGIDATNSLYGSHRVDDRVIHYTRSVGLDPKMTDVVMARAAEGLKALGPTSSSSRPAHYDAFLEWIRGAGTRDFGEIRISASEELWTIRHRSETFHDKFTDPMAAWEIARFDAGENHRPLRSAPTLRDGWIFNLSTEADVLAAVEAFYPGQIRSWFDAREGEFETISFPTVADHQTGMYARVNEADISTVAEAVVDCCRAGCLRRIAWDIENGRPPEGVRGEGPLQCGRACGLLLTNVLQRQS